MIYKCLNCGTENQSSNYCNWNCSIEYAKKSGGKTITPNNLPINCIKANHDMLECEHGDHEDYKFPVKVESFGKKEELPEWDHSYENQKHALIYTDGFVALTLYECQYYLFHLNGGKLMTKCSFGDWKLTEDSIKKIKKSIMPFKTTPVQIYNLGTIEGEMEERGVNIDLINRASELAKSDQGVYDLMELWNENKDDEHLRDDIITDLYLCLKDYDR